MYDLTKVKVKLGAYTKLRVVLVFITSVALEPVVDKNLLSQDTRAI